MPPVCTTGESMGQGITTKEDMGVAYKAENTVRRFLTAATPFHDPSRGVIEPGGSKFVGANEGLRCADSRGLRRDADARTRADLRELPRPLRAA